MKIYIALIASLLLFSSSGIKDVTTNTDNGLKEIVRHLEKNFIGKMRETPHLAKAHFTETILNNDKYTGYFESLGYAIYMGEKNGNVAPYTKYKFYCENTKDKLDNSPGTTSCLRESLRFRYYGPFSNNKYSFEIAESNEEYLTINCFSKKENPNFSKVIVKVDRDNLQVLEVSYATKTLYSQVYLKRLDGNVKISYAYINDEPFVSGIETSYKKGSMEHRITFNVLDQNLKSFDLTRDEFWAFNAYDHNPSIYFDPSQWNLLGVNPPNDYEKIRLDLQITSIEDFFLVNSDLEEKDAIEPSRHKELAQNKMSDLKNTLY